MGILGISSRIVTGPFGKKIQLFRNILFSNFSKNGLRVDEQGLTDSKKCASKSEQMQHRCLVRGAKNYSPGQIKLHKEKSAGEVYIKKMCTQVFSNRTILMRCGLLIFHNRPKYGTHHSYVLVVHTLRVAENKILKLDFPAKRH
jgi:hypothetical protein